MISAPEMEQALGEPLWSQNHTFMLSPSKHNMQGHLLTPQAVLYF